MRTVDWLQNLRHAVPGELSSQPRGEMRDAAHFPLVACAISLYPGEITLAESSRLGVFPEKKLVGAIHVLDSRPGVVAVEKSERRFQQVTVADVSARDILISPPEQERIPVSFSQRT